MSRGNRKKPGPRADRRPGAETGWPLRIAAGLIVLAGLLAYSNSFRGVFVLDEQSAIVDNPNIRSLSTSFSAPPEVGLGGRPIASLSFALNYALAPPEGREAFSPPPPGYPPAARELFYRNLWGYHAANLAIHVCSALALFGITRRTLSVPRLRPAFGPASLPLALTVSLLWVVHPLNTSAITYVAQRVESLMGLFLLLTFYCGIRASVAGPRSRAAWTAAAIAACALGAGTKEVVVVAPLLMMAWDWVFGGREPDAAPGQVPAAAPGGTDGALRPAPRWGLYLGLFASWAIVLALVLAFPRAASVGGGATEWSPLRYLATQAGIIVHYLRLAVVPWPLAFDYEWPAVRGVWPVVAPGSLLVVLLGVSAWRLWHRTPSGFLGAWFFLILAPSSSVLPIVTEIAAEHRMYLPLAAVIALVVCGVYAAARRRGPTRVTWRALGLVSLAAVVVLGVETYARNADYHSYEQLWADTVARRPDNARARSNYATALLEAGRVAEAEAQLRAAIAIRPDYPEAQANYGATLCTQGRLEEGILHLRRAVELSPHYLDAYRNLGEALSHLGRNGEALETYRRVLALSPGDTVAMSRAAWLLATSPEDSVRNGEEAVRLGQQAVQATRGLDAGAVDALAAAFAESGRFAEAVAAGEQAVALARQRGDEAVTREFEAKLQAYRAGQPIRSGPPR